jgi:hypothetical protein
MAAVGERFHVAATSDAYSLFVLPQVFVVVFASAFVLRRVSTDGTATPAGQQHGSGSGTVGGYGTSQGVFQSSRGGYGGDGSASARSSSGNGNIVLVGPGR